MQIRKHFAATAWDFVNDAILDMIADGELDCGPGNFYGATTRYWIPETQPDKDLRVAKAIVRACP